ncbi:MAG: hypothetical protein OXJ36_10995 [bacterium]|nr:hypothetical protein [bacterium]
MATVRTVLGEISPDDLGITMSHEHLLLDTSHLFWHEPSTSDPPEIYALAGAAATRMKAKREHRVPLRGRGWRSLARRGGWAVVHCRLGGGSASANGLSAVPCLTALRGTQSRASTDSIYVFEQLRPNALTPDRCPPMLDHLAPVPSGLGAARPRALLETGGSSSELLTYRSPNGLDHLIEDRKSVQ